MSKQETLTEKFRRLADERDLAYRKWKNTIKAYLDDGKEKPIVDEESDNEDGAMLVRVGNYGYNVDGYADKVRYNNAHKAFQFHFIELDGNDADQYIMDWELSREDVKRLLEHIVWE